MNNAIIDLKNKDTSWISILKGVAIAGIILYHWFQESNLVVLKTIFRIGGQGIYIFFILSSFGISLSLMNKQKKIKWLGWYKKRFIKLIIPYYFSIFIILLFFFIYGVFTGSLPKVLTDNGVNWGSVLASFFLYRSFVGKYVIEINPVWWFVVTIFELYLLFPILYFIYFRVNKSLLLFSTLILTFTYQIFYSTTFGPENLVFSKFSFNFLFVFAFGIYLADLFINHKEEFIKLLLGLKPFLCGIVLQFIGAYLALKGSIWGALDDIFIAIGFFVILINFLYFFKLPKYVVSLLIWFGDHSLGVFLLHLPFIPLFFRLGGTKYLFVAFVFYLIFLYMIVTSFTRILAQTKITSR